MTASSGNTACALAYVAQKKGYPCIVVTNTKCSKEKQEDPKKYGARVIVTRSGVPADSPDHYMNVAASMCRDAPDKYFDLNQVRAWRFWLRSRACSCISEDVPGLHVWGGERSQHLTAGAQAPTPVTFVQGLLIS